VVEFNGKEYDAINFCDILHANSAEALAEYKEDFYKNMRAVTKNRYGDGTAYYCAFANSGDFFQDFAKELISTINIAPDTGIETEKGISVRKRGDVIFVMNFADNEKQVTLDKEYTDVLTGKAINGTVTLNKCEYLILK
jgi:beta-galactosidase